jgi:hypothetical protein
LPTIEPGAVLATGQITCTIEAWGWWYTLAWRYANVPSTLAFAYDKTTTTYTIGKDDTADVVAYAQAFDVGAVAWNILEVELQVTKTGTPPEDLTVAIYTNPDDATPTDTVVSTSLTPAEVGTATRTRFSFSAAEALSANTSYFLVVTTSGLDASNYYSIALDGDGGYSAGPLVKKVGSTWSSATGDLAWRIYTNDLVENTQQIKSLATNYGQFFEKVLVLDAASISTESYRNGDSDAQFEIEELLNAGNTDGRRLLARVTSDRFVEVYAEDEPSPLTGYGVTADGKVYNHAALVDRSTCPVAVWAHLRHVLPGGLDTAQLSGLGTFFIEWSEYDPNTDTWRFEPLGMQDRYETEVNQG